jgi:hypothetical protein
MGTNLKLCHLLQIILIAILETQIIVQQWYKIFLSQGIEWFWKQTIWKMIFFFNWGLDVESQDHLGFYARTYGSPWISFSKQNTCYHCSYQQLMIKRTLNSNLSFMCILKPNPTHAQRDNV